MSRPFRLQPLEVPESTIQDAILRFLQWDRRVAWAERFNTGAHLIEGTTGNGKKSRRFIQYAFKGCSDILGQLVDGRFLAVEVKTRSGRATKEQQAFLDKVDASGGVAVLARSVDEVKNALDAVCDQRSRSPTAASVAGGRR